MILYEKISRLMDLWLFYNVKKSALSKMWFKTNVFPKSLCFHHSMGM